MLARSTPLLALLCAVGCAAGRPPAAAGPEPAEAAPPAPPATLPSLAERYRGAFHVGAAVTGGQVMVEDTAALIARQFDVIVLEDEMKPLQLARQQGSYAFGTADRVVNWALQHGLKVRGHVLVWHQQAAPWMFTRDGAPVGRAELIERMRTYIHDVVGHFRGRVWAWDVVNEALAPGEPESADGFRASEWYRIIGPEYVELAFRFAHEADPDALLFYNDFDTEAPARRDRLVALLRDLRAKGVPVHGVGHQAHCRLGWPPVEELERSIQAVAALGLRNHVTELDVGLRERDGAPLEASTPERIARQADRYRELFRMFLRNRQAIDAVLLWGVSDERSWRRAEEPLLFSEYRPKPAFWAVLDAAGEAP